MNRVTGHLVLLGLLILPPDGAVRGQMPGVEPSKRQGPERVLFNGRTLDGWRVIDQNYFDEHGAVAVQDGRIVMEAGNPATGISWIGKQAFPRDNYEVELEAARLEGSDFFCGLTFPVGESYCTFIAGGWGGGVTGLSNLDGVAAVENETTDFVEFEQGRWYRIRLRVVPERVQVWIDDKQLVDVVRRDRKFSIWWEQEPVRPFGVATWYTKAAVRKIVLRTSISPVAPDKGVDDKK